MKTTLAKSAFQKAADLYEHHRIEPGFYAELSDHLHNGIVIARPSMFMMGKAVALEGGEAAWFITAAVGDLRMLMAHCPCPLPYIAFRRRGQENMRVYDFDRFMSRAHKLCRNK